MARKFVPLVGSLILSWFCGASPSSPPPPPPAVKVTLAPVTGSIHVNTSLQFTATVQNSLNTAVVWSLSGDGCNGTACGTISDTGLYTAPASLPAPPSVTVKATSVSDSTKSASATVHLFDPITITVRPPEILVTAGLVRRFGALVENAIDDRVTWTLSGSTGSGPEYGTITDEGLYTAPELVPADPIVTITATSVEDPAVSGSTSATIRPAGANEVIWTWVSGSDRANAPRVGETKGLPAPANDPGARGAASSWIDPAGNLWLFGGFGASFYSGPTFNDLWKFDPLTNEWTWVSGSDAGAQSGVFGTKGVADPSNVPGSKLYAASWCDPRGTFWLFGGWGWDSLGQSGPMNDLWSFDPATGLWTYMSGFYLRHEFGRYGTKGVPDATNVPGARSESATWIDASGRLWLFGGYGFDRTGWQDMLNDLWMFDPVTSEWTWISGSDLAGDPGEYGSKGVPSPSNRPPCRSNMATWVDLGGRLWLFGGYDWYGPAYFGDLWRFDPADGRWTWVSGSEWPGAGGVYGTQGVADPRNVPGSRYLSASWTGPDGRFWLFGGEGFYSESGFGTLNDLWRYDPAANEWTWVGGVDAADQPGSYVTKNTPDLSNAPGGRYYALSWLDAVGRFWLWGGGGVDSVKDENNLNDLWYFTPLVAAPAKDGSGVGPRRLR